jgi:hypothetical protein
MKKTVAALLIGTNLEIWASGSDGNIDRFQHAMSTLTRLCGCINPQAYSIYGVKGTMDGVLHLRDNKGKLHIPVDPCTRGSFQGMISFLADLSNAPKDSRRMFVFWSLDPANVKEGYFITSVGDTINLWRPVQ